MDDVEARVLLQRLHKYVMEFKPDLPQSIPALAEDLAVSMDKSISYNEELLKEIQEAYNG